MNKNFNLVEILKDCPKGTKLYSTIHGEVKFEKIIFNDDYPIKFNIKDTALHASVSIDGRFSTSYKGECTLFPSKDQRDWSKFNIEPKFDINTLQPFDKVLTRDWDDSTWRCNIYEYFKKGKCYPFITMNGVCNQCVPYNEETKHLVGTTAMPPKKYITWEG